MTACDELFDRELWAERLSRVGAAGLPAIASRSIRPELMAEGRRGGQGGGEIKREKSTTTRKAGGLTGTLPFS